MVMFWFWVLRDRVGIYFIIYFGVEMERSIVWLRESIGDILLMKYLFYVRLFRYEDYRLVLFGWEFYNILL